MLATSEAFITSELSLNCTLPFFSSREVAHVQKHRTCREEAPQSFRLLAIPHLSLLHALDFLLQLQNTVEQRLGRRRTTGNIDIYRDDAVASADNWIWVVVIATAIGTTSHWDNPARLGHLIVDLAECRRHFVRDGASDDDAVSLTWTGTKHDAKPIHIVSKRQHGHNTSHNCSAAFAVRWTSRTHPQ